MRIGVVDFLNAWPLWGALENETGVTLIRDVPSALALKLRSGSVDCALISSVEYFRLPQGYSFHPTLCIAADHEVRSIRLFVTKREHAFDETVKHLSHIYTDAASRSSVAQLKAILAKLHADIPLREIEGAAEKIPHLRADEAILSIGDTALKFRERPSFDLQSEYYRLFGRGFVYALWVYPNSLRTQVEPLLDNAYEAYQADQLRLRAVAVERFGFPAAFTEEYLTRIIKHKLTAERRGDLEFFQSQNTA